MPTISTILIGMNEAQRAAKKEYMRQWNKKNRERIREYRLATADRRNAQRRENYAQSPAMRKKAVQAATAARKRQPLRRRVLQFGLDEETLEILMGRGCAICHANPAIDPTTRLHVDHDHSTGKARGILCQPCNLALGHFQDDPIVITAALEYLLRGGDSDLMTNGLSGAG